MAEPQTFIYEIEDTVSGTIYEIEGPEGVPEADLLSFVASQRDTPQGAQTQPQAPPQGLTPGEPITPMKAADYVPAAESRNFFDDKSIPVEMAQEHDQLVADLIQQGGGQIDPQAYGQARSALNVKHGYGPDVDNADEWTSKYNEYLATGGDKMPSVSVNTPQEQFGIPDPGATVQSMEELHDPTAPLAPVGKFLAQMTRSGQEALQHWGAGLAARKAHQWMGSADGIVDEMYPDASPEEKKRIASDFISWTQRKVREANELEIAEDGMAPWLIGQVFTPDFIDLFPGSKFARLGAKEAATAGQRAATRVAEGAVLSGGADVGYQAVEVRDNVRDEIDYEQSAMAGAFGGALHGSIEGGKALYRTFNDSAKGSPTVQAGEGLSSYLELQSSDAGSARLTETREGALTQAKEYVAEVSKDWNNAPEFDVVADKSDIADPRVRNGMHDDAVGMFVPEQNKVVINLKNVDSPETLSAVLFHETLGHHGLQQKFREELDDVLYEIYDGGTESFRQAVDDYRAKNPDTYAGRPDAEAREIEEVFAQMSEDGRIEASLFNRVALAVKQSIRDFLGMDIKFSDKEIKTILGMAHDAVVNGKPGDVVGNGFRFMSPAREQAFLEYTQARNIQPSKLFDELEAGRNPEAEAEISARAAQMEEVSREVADNSSTEVYDRREPNDGMYDSRKAVELINRAEQTPGAVQTERMWPDNENLVDFRYVDPDTKSEIYGAFQKKGDVADGLEIYGDGRNSVGPKAVREIHRQLKEQFPDIKRVKAVRISGARHKGAEVRVSEGTPVESRFMKKPTDRELAALRKRDHELRANTRRENLAQEGFAADRRGIDREEIGLPPKYASLQGRFMMKKRLTDEEVLDSENALHVLKALTNDYKAKVLSKDDIIAEAEMRNLSPSRVLASKGFEPGDLSRRMVMFDIAADKYNTKLGQLYDKNKGGEWSTKDRESYLETIARFEELTSKIFDEQGEIGRALAIFNKINYTRKKVGGLKESIKEMLAENEALNDPETFNRFATIIQKQMEESMVSKADSKISNFLGNALNLPRSIMSSADFSAPFRQGAMFVHKPEFWKSLIPMFKAAWSQKYFDGMMADIASRDTYPLMVEANVPFSGASEKLSRREEAFMSAWAEKLPFIGPMIKASERAYTGFLNKVRADVFDSLLKNAEKAGLDLASNPKALKDLGKYIGAASGRGDLGSLNSSTPLLTSIFFSPRLIKSRLDMLNPVFYLRLDPFVRKEAMKSLLAYAAMSTTVLFMANKAGLGVEVDPRSADFGKVKVGKSRYDVMAGFAQYITLAARLATGQTKAANGKIIDYSDGTEFGGTTRADAVFRFLSNKAAPVPSFAHDALRGTDAVGQPFEAKSALAQRFISMFLQDMYEVMEEEGFAKGALMASPGLFGVGIQTYTPRAVDPYAELIASKTFDMADLDDGENDMVTVRDGTVTLKPEARKEWSRLLNEYTKELMDNEGVDWETLPPKEKEELIKDIRKDARALVKEDMLPVLGIE